MVLDPWRSGVGRRALLEVALLGAVCGPIGFWVVSERLSYGAESLAHALLPGPVLAGLAGLPLLLGAAAGTMAAAALIALGARDRRVGCEGAAGDGHRLQVGAHGRSVFRTRGPCDDSHLVIRGRSRLAGLHGPGGRVPCNRTSQAQRA